MTYHHLITSEALFAVPPPPLPVISKAFPAVTKDPKILLYHKRISQLKALELRMARDRDSLSEQDWQNIIKLSGVLRNEIEGILSEFEKLKKRKQRKKPRKRINKKIVRSNKEILSSRQELHDQIDSWRKLEHDKLIQEKTAEEHKRNLQRTLKDNSKRTKEALTLITKLESTIERKLIECPAGSEIIRKLTQLVAVWKDALAEYDQERSQLQEELGITTTTSIMETQELWLECLFGEKDTSWLPDLSLEDFIRVRSQWDCHLTTTDVDQASTQIPLFWVLPPTTSTSFDLWANYRR